MIRPATILRRGLLTSVVALALLAGAEQAAGPGRVGAGGPTVSLTLVAGGLDVPLGIVNAADGSGRLFIVEQTGKIKIIDSGGTLLLTEFIDLGSLLICNVSPCGEQGLLGLAFHPNYEGPGTGAGLFYVQYTNVSGHNVIAQYSVSGDPNIALTTGTILKTINQEFANHNGGQLQFGPDGYLYAAKGDGGGLGDTLNRAQDPAYLLGKLIRLDVDAAAPYIPPTNPYASPSDGVLDEIWAFGLRNPWRFSFDRASGEIFIGDVGQGEWEEVSRQVPWSAGKENYGWRLMEGAHCYNPATNCDDGDPVLTYPILEHPHSDGSCSVTGGYRYRGLPANSLAGYYIYSDYCTGIIYAAAEDGGGKWTETVALESPHNISTFGEAENGQLYVANHDLEPDGAVYRVDAATSADGDADGVANSADNCVATQNALQSNDDSRRLGVALPTPDRTNPHADAPGNACDADDDNDGRSDVDETAAGTCPGLAYWTLPQCHAGGIVANPLIADPTDTDGDVFTDGYEALQGSDPLNVASRTCTLGDCTDTDADGVPNVIETGAGSNPALADTDGDGLSDAIELRHRATSPLLADTDGGGCSDRREVFSIDANNGVSFGDLLLFAAAYGATGPALGVPSAKWDANKDYNGNSTVAFSDLLIFAGAYGLSCAPGVDLST